MQAFEYYYGLGDKRSYPKVAKEFKVITQTIYNWSKALNWKKRVKTRDARIAEMVQDNLETSVAQKKTDFINMLLDDITKAQYLKIDSHYDKRESIKLFLTLMGEPTEITEIQVKHLVKVSGVIVQVLSEVASEKVVSAFNDRLKERLPQLIENESS